MTTYKILYWQEVASQIKAEDDADDSARDIAEAVVAELEAKVDW